MYLLLANPTSGAGRGGEVKELVMGALRDHKVSFLDISGSSYESASVNLRNALIETPPKAVIIIGGDGMVHLAIQELAESAIPLILIPAGTGNDFARSLGLNVNSPLKSLEHALESPATCVDLGLVNGRYFAEILSTGFDSRVNERANRMPMKSKKKYDVAMLLELPVFEPLEYEIAIDGHRFKTEAMLIAVANGISYGGGMKICPNADLEDGLFDLMVLEPVSKLEFLKVFPKVFKGSHISHPRVKIHRGRKIEIKADAVAYADGERIGELPITAEIVPGALRTWTYR